MLKINKLLFLSPVITAFLLLSFVNLYSQGRDRSKFQYNITDTSFVSEDTSRITDTSFTKVIVDSTARIKYFKYERKDGFIPLFEKHKHPLLIYGSSRVEYKISFDSSGSVLITETFQGEDIKVPLKMSFDDYIKLRQMGSLRAQFYRIVAEKYKIETKDELEELFKNITEITIPLPFATETIFGPPTATIRINGVIDITGSYQKNSTDQLTFTQTSQDQNNINFKQEVQVTTKGIIGDKLTIDADWNSQRTFEFENQLKLKYKGYPDEVIQSIEAGNVSLETKSNLIGSTQALFGVKAQFKLGPLTLTALASQKKSEKREINITGGAVENPINIPIYDYSINNYFVDTLYKSVFEFYFSTEQTIDSLKITEIEVWVQTTPNNPKKRTIVAAVQLPLRPAGGYFQPEYTTQSDSDGYRMTGFFYKLEETEYTVNKEAGFVTISTNLPQAPNDGVAIAYKTIVNNQTRQFGDFANDVGSQDRLILKVARYKGLQPPKQNANHSTAWELMLKNIYNVGVRNIKRDPSKLEFKIVRIPSGSAQLENYLGDPPAGGKSYLNLTKLDIKQNNGTSKPEGDGYFDFFPGRTVDLDNGNIIFPTLRPFSATLISSGVNPDSVRINDTIYVDSKSAGQNSQLQFWLVGKAVGDASSRYNLGFNIVENSVKVFNGTVPLAEGIDYTIDYGTGELVIRNASALLAGSNLKITYESNDLFQLASKTLLGTRAELQINKTSYLGFTLLNLKQQTLNDKIRIGEEPTNNTIIGFDASTDIKTNFLTKFINKIPGYNTKDESLLTLKGEVAFMIPDPNTKKSRIPSDNGEAVAYIDDFEGSKKIIPLGLNPLSWTISSIPIDTILVPVSSYNTPDVRDSLMSLKRSRMEWYTLLNNVLINEVYPNRTIGNTQSRTLSPLVLDIKPDTVGSYNFITQETFSFTSSITNRWTGFFKWLNTSQTNLLDENINYIEVWMKVGFPDEASFNNVYLPRSFQPGDSAKMIIDLGLMTEKIITSTVLKPNANDTLIKYHTEDKNNSGQLDVDEDIGVDGYSDQQEIALFPSLAPDPSRDNFAWTQGSTDFTKFNGTEGNATTLTEAKKIETEDLNNNGALDNTNSFLQYVIPLDSANFKNLNYLVGGGNNGWFQLNIPLSEFSKAVGGELNSILTNVQYIRIWFKGFDKTARVKIVDASLVGNQWVKAKKNDTSYTIGVVSIEDNSNIYSPPVPGDILRQRDQSQVDQNVLSNEQSISVYFKDLTPGQGRFIYKTYNTKPLDLINYRIIKLFVNGDPSFQYTDTSNYDAAMVVRVGSDTSNFYEYRAPIHPDYRPGTPWNPFNEVSINLSDMTGVKQVRDSTNITSYSEVPNGPPGAKFGVKGNPSIRAVTQIVLGIVNNKNDPGFAQTISGAVWFNEMRVIKTNDKGGYSYTLNAALKMADLGALNFSYSKVDPNFHSLEGRFGNLVLSNSWEFSGTLNLHKILNSLLSNYASIKLKDFFTIPLNFSHAEVYEKPDYLTNSDVLTESAAQRKYQAVLDSTGDQELAQYLADELRISSQTLSITNRFSVSGMKFTFPSDNFFVREILNKTEISFYRNSITQRSPTTESKYAWDIGGTIGVTSNLNLLEKLNLNIGRFIPLGDEYREAKIYLFFPFLPIAPLYSSSMNIGTNFTRKRGDEKLRAQITQNPTSREFSASRGIGLDWKFIENWIIDVGGTYSFSAGSDLTFLETTSDSLKNQRSNGEIIDDIFLNDGLIYFGKDLSSTQSFSINPKFNIPVLKKFLDLTASYRVQYGWAAQTFNPALGNNVGYNADLQSSAFLKLNQLFALFKPSSSKLEGGSQSFFQDEQRPEDILKLLASFIPDGINMTYSQSRLLTNPGIGGRPGFGNFWMVLGSKENLGPSRLYQLGWSTYPGERMPNIVLTDREGVTNTINLNTFITPIFPNNLKISFTYKVTNSLAKNLTYLTAQNGSIGTPTSVIETKIITVPSFFSGGDVVQSLPEPISLDPNQTAKEISDAFEKNMVSFPFPSWTLTLNGIEKFELFTGFASSVSLESGYSAEYKKTLYYDGTKAEYIRNQVLNTGFSPLISFNITFKPIEEGNLNASFKLNKTSNFDLDPLSAKVNQTQTSDFSINASYSKTGFTFPLFGLSLKNDLTIAFSYTHTKNDPILYQLQAGSWNSNVQNGSISTLLNPSVQYALSKSVSIQIFYKYNKIEPTQGSLQIPTRTSNEAGLNVKLTIQ